MMNRFFMVAWSLGLFNQPTGRSHWYEHTASEQQAFDRMLSRKPRMLVAG